jgi:type IV secretion system protein VirB1
MRKLLNLLVLSVTAFGHITQIQAAPASTVVEKLAVKCAPDVSPQTMAYLVGHESGNQPYAIGINSSDGPISRYPATEQEAVQTAKKLLAGLKKGESLDLGLAMINSKNLKGLGIPVEAVFEPCTNLRASQTILKTCYDTALKSFPPGQQALRHALSCYNTGSQERGISNGYVTKVENVARISTLKIPTLIPEGESVNSTDETAVNDAPTVKKHAEGEPDAFGDDDKGEADAFGAGNDGDAFTLNNSDAVKARRGSAQEE